MLNATSRLTGALHTMYRLRFCNLFKSAYISQGTVCCLGGCQGPRRGYVALMFPNGSFSQPRQCALLYAMHGESTACTSSARASRLELDTKHTPADSTSGIPAVMQAASIPCTMQGHMNYRIRRRPLSREPNRSKPRVWHGLRVIHCCCRKTSA